MSAAADSGATRTLSCCSSKCHGKESNTENRQKKKAKMSERRVRSCHRLISPFDGARVGGGGFRRGVGLLGDFAAGCGGGRVGVEAAVPGAVLLRGLHLRLEPARWHLAPLQAERLVALRAMQTVTSGLAALQISNERVQRSKHSHRQILPHEAAKLVTLHSTNNVFQGEEGRKGSRFTGSCSFQLDKNYFLPTIRALYKRVWTTQ